MLALAQPSESAEDTAGVNAIRALFTSMPWSQTHTHDTRNKKENSSSDGNTDTVDQSNSDSSDTDTPQQQTKDFLFDDVFEDFDESESDMDEAALQTSQLFVSPQHSHLDSSRAETDTREDIDIVADLETPVAPISAHTDIFAAHLSALASSVSSSAHTRSPTFAAQYELHCRWLRMESPGVRALARSGAVAPLLRCTAPDVSASIRCEALLVLTQCFVGRLLTTRPLIQKGALPALVHSLVKPPSVCQKYALLALRALLISAEMELRQWIFRETARNTVDGAEGLFDDDDDESDEYENEESESESESSNAEELLSSSHAAPTPIDHLSTSDDKTSSSSQPFQLSSGDIEYASNLTFDSNYESNVNNAFNMDTSTTSHFPPFSTLLSHSTPFNPSLPLQNQPFNTLNYSFLHTDTAQSASSNSPPTVPAEYLHSTIGSFTYSILSYLDELRLGTHTNAVAHLPRRTLCSLACDVYLRFTHLRRLFHIGPEFLAEQYSGYLS